MSEPPTETEFKDFPYGTSIEKREKIWITREMQANDPQLPGLLLAGWEPYAGTAIVAPHPVTPSNPTIMPIIFLRTQEDVMVAILPNGNIEVLPPNVVPRIAAPPGTAAELLASIGLEAPQK